MSDMTNKTHYRKAFNSPYLSSADIVEPTILTVKCVRLEKDLTKKTKDFFNTAYFAESHLREGEPLKPMILNAYNSRVLRQLSGSHFIEDWNDIAITVYVDSNVRFGKETVEGLRISTEAPRLQKPELTPDQTKAWANAIAAYKRDGNLNAVFKRMSVSLENQTLIQKQAAA